MYLLWNLCFDFRYDLCLKWYKTCDKPPTYFAHFRPSSGWYSTKWNTLVASYILYCNNKLKYRILQWVKILKNTVHYVYRNRYYLNCKQISIAAIHVCFQGYILVPPMEWYDEHLTVFWQISAVAKIYGRNIFIGTKCREWARNISA